MKIVFGHNAYHQRGGEDAVVEAEARLLEAHGHRVVRYERHNDELRGQGPLGRLATGIETVWASRSYRELAGILAREKPDIAHFHNTFPLISPSGYYACAEAGVPVVQTLHNYRLICPAATFLRDGRVCEDCLHRSVPWPSVLHGCYRGSRPATAAVAAMLAAHRTMGTLQTKVNVYIALSEFARRKFIEGGLPPERVLVKPNFLYPDPGVGNGRGEYVLFVGRLSEEKGLRVLLAACSRLRDGIPLRIVGDGPLKDEIASEIEAKGLSGIELMGRLAPEEIVPLMAGVRFLLFPSVCFETFGISIIEAFACGRPVIASRLGAMEEIVEDGRTGLHFTSGDSEDLAAKVEWAWSHPEEMSEMGRAARARFEEKYTAERAYENLMGIYRQALEGTSPYAKS